MRFGTEFWVAVPAIAAILALAFAALGHMWRKMLRPLSLMILDWNGTDPRDGVPGRPGVMHRLAALETGQAEARAAQVAMSTDVSVIRQELFPNGGQSLADRVDQIAAAVGAAPPRAP